MPRGWGSKLKVGQLAVYKFKVYSDQVRPRSMVRVLDSTEMFCKHHATKTPIAWLKNGEECGWYLCPTRDLRPATKKEIFTLYLQQL